MEALWPGKAPNDGANNLFRAVNDLRAVIGRDRLDAAKQAVTAAQTSYLADGAQNGTSGSCCSSTWWTAPRWWSGAGAPVTLTAVGERLLERVGGRIAFGRAIDVRMWEGDLAAGRAHTFDYVVPATNARKGGVRARDLPDTVVPLALIRGGSLEIVNAETKWQGGDTLAVLTTHDEPAAEALLNQLHSKEP